MEWNDGRTLAINGDVDSFRRLTEEELAKEQETQNETMDDGGSPVMGM